NVRAVFFDKTGTLTRGEFRVAEITTVGNLKQDDALTLAAAVEHDSEHTIAQGIVKSAEERALRVPAADGFQSLARRVVQARLNGRRFRLGGPPLLRESQVQLDPKLQQAMDRAASRGEAAITMLDGGNAVAVLSVADAVRPESRDAVKRLHDQ